MTLAVITVIAALVAAAVDYTHQQGRLAHRTLVSQTAMEIGDGHLEWLFTHWRNTCRGTSAFSVLPTNYFYTQTYQPAAQPSSNPPPLIPLPSKSFFPDVPQEYQITNFRIQAVDPMLQLKQNFPSYWGLIPSSYTGTNPAAEQSTLRFTDVPPSGKTALYKTEDPRCFPGAFGAGLLQYSFYYLASVDVTYPARGGPVTAKVRRVFEKRFNTPWSWGIFYHGDLELHPNAPLTINGPIQTNSNLFTGSNKLTLTDNTTYSGNWVVGWAPEDTAHTGTPSAPVYPADLPPSETPSSLPFGWNAAQLFDPTDGNPNNDGYREIIERPVSGSTDPLATALPQGTSARYYDQADVKVLIDGSNNVTIYNEKNQVITASSTNSNDKNKATAINAALSKDQVLQDNREAATVRCVTLDIAKLKSSVDSGQLKNSSGGAFNGVIYVSDTSGSKTLPRAVRLRNGSALPSGGLTVVSDNPVYIWGNYNTGTNPPSNSGDPTKPTPTNYNRAYAAVIADSVTVLSDAWSDVNSVLGVTSRKASNTTVNAAVLAGIVPSSNGKYGGGAENFLRFLEDWSGRTFTYYGSMVQLFNSEQAIGTWGKANVYVDGTRHIYYDTNFTQWSPPGDLVIAGYLQQQRWYLAY